MEFNHGTELLELCEKNKMPISLVMKKREAEFSGITEEEVEKKMRKAWKIMKESARKPLKDPVLSIGGLIGGEAKKLKEYHAEHIVVDPVMVSTSGSRLLEEAAQEALKERLLPLASVITPNIPEAEALTDQQITGEKEMEDAARRLGELYPGGVLIKGGHQISDANDLLYYKGETTWFRGERIDNPNTHGTGCTLSSAIASNLAKGYSMEESIRRAKAYISGALRAGLDLGKGSGPMDHGWAIPEIKL